MNESAGGNWGGQVLHIYSDKVLLSPSHTHTHTHTHTNTQDLDTYRNTHRHAHTHTHTHTHSHTGETHPPAPVVSLLFCPRPPLSSAYGRKPINFNKPLTPP